MGDFTLRDFAETYITVSLETAQTTPYMDEFYNRVFTEVSKRTGLSQEDVKYIHHTFHRGLFLESGHPLEIVDFPRGNGDFKVGIKSPIEPADLVSRILERHGIMLEERFRKISDNQKANIPDR